MCVCVLLRSTLELCKYFIIAVKFDDGYIQWQLHTHTRAHIYIYKYTHTTIYRHFTESSLSAQRNKKNYKNYTCVSSFQNNIYIIIYKRRSRFERCVQRVINMTKKYENNFLKRLWKLIFCCYFFTIDIFRKAILGIYNKW